MTTRAKLESQFVHDVLKPELERRFPGCEILKQEPLVTFQGIPDLLVLWGNRWAALETKKARKSERQPNQEYHVARLDHMSFADFVHPGNYEQVLDELERAFNT
jgi:hypothetical protein